MPRMRMPRRPMPMPLTVMPGLPRRASDRSSTGRNASCSRVITLIEAGASLAWRAVAVAVTTTGSSSCGCTVTGVSAWTGKAADKATAKTVGNGMRDKREEGMEIEAEK